jgi:hypothetical protein
MKKWAVPVETGTILRTVHQKYKEVHYKRERDGAGYFFLFLNRQFYWNRSSSPPSLDRSVGTEETPLVVLMSNMDKFSLCLHSCSAFEICISQDHKRLSEQRKAGTSVLQKVTWRIFFSPLVVCDFKEASRNFFCVCFYITTVKTCENYQRSV